VSKLILKRVIFTILFTFGIGSFIIQAMVTDLSETPIPGFDTISPFVDSNRFTHQKSEALATSFQTPFAESTEITTPYGTAYVEEDSLSFQVMNDNGYLWSSSVNYDVPGLSNAFKTRLKSAVFIEFYNTKNPSFATDEDSMFTSGTTHDFELIEYGFHSTITFGKSDITIGLYVVFGEDTITVSIPNDEIIEGEDFKLKSIRVYPYFGAVLEDNTPGYIFLPDGVGALIDYKQTDPLIDTNYEKSIYDRNIGFNTQENLNNFVSTGTKIYAPVFGFVHGINQNAVFANIKEGAPYGMLYVLFPSNSRGFSTVFSQFNYRTTYSQPIDKVGNTISLLQQERNEFDIEIKYSLLTDDNANYVGMAKSYREDLESLLPGVNASSRIPLRLDTIGLEKKEGLLFPETIVMTTLAQFEDMILDLNARNITDIYATYRGFTSSGVTWSAPKYERFASRLGSASDLESLSQKVTELMVEIEVMKASNRSSGYNQYFDLAKKINSQLYRYDSGTDQKYLLEHAKVSSIFHHNIEKLGRYPITGLAIESMGGLLYDDFDNDQNLLDLIDQLEEMLSSSEYDIVLKEANAYLWGLMDHFYDFPMYSSQYVIFDDTVPFMSIVLSGNMTLFGPYANFYPYARDELLRLIDFGVYPSFIVTEKSSKYLQKTGLESIYSSRYEDIAPLIETYVDFVDGALSYVIGQTIEHREVLANGLVLVTYSNGISIAINYRNQTMTVSGVSISPKSYHVFM
jgi:hypothetical protein